MSSTYNVKKARELAGLSQRELADALNIAQQSVYYYESGSRDIKASMLLKIAEITGVTPSYLLGLTANPHEEVVPSREADSDLSQLVQNFQTLDKAGRAVLLTTSNALVKEFAKTQNNDAE